LINNVYIIVHIQAGKKELIFMLEKAKILRAQEGDIKSIEEICSSTWEPLYRFIYRKVQNREEAEDITQEAYVRALSKVQGGDTRVDKYISYLKVISLNILRDRWRRKKRRGITINLDDVKPMEAAFEDTAALVAQRDFIKSALNKLNEEQRNVIELRILKGYSVAETAQIMDKRDGTVRVIQYRALQNLAALMKSDS
jgi:RNA polymerase sigma-70 factor (ECF subfamily)